MHYPQLRRRGPALVAAMTVAVGVATPLAAASPASSRTPHASHAARTAAKKKAAPAVTKAEVNSLIKAYLKQHPSVGKTGPAGAAGAPGPDWTTGSGLAVNNDVLTINPGPGLEVNSANQIQLDSGVTEGCPGLQFVQQVSQSGPTCSNSGVDFFASSGLAPTSSTPTDALSGPAAIITDGTHPLQVTLDANDQVNQSSVAYLVNAQIQFNMALETSPQCEIINAATKVAVATETESDIPDFGGMDIQTAVYVPKYTVLAVECGGGSSGDLVGGSLSAIPMAYQLNY